MKKTGLILAIVAVLVAVVFYVDKKTRLTRTDVAHADLAAGSPEPAVSMKNLDGNQVSLADLKGKVVLVNFWATWCDPCQVEIPSLIELQQKFGVRGFTVLGVAMDEEGASVVAPFVGKQRFDVKGQKELMNYPIVIGNDEVAEKFGGLIGYPTSVLISKDGKIVKRVTGIVDEDEISKTIQSLL